MKLRDKYTCPLELTHDMIKGKWKPIILWRLRHKNTSLSQLKKDINGISEKMLIEHLNELIEFKLVEKKVYSGYPLKVEYFLTKNKGNKIIKALQIMQEIGIEFMLENNLENVLKEKGIF